MFQEQNTVTGLVLILALVMGMTLGAAHPATQSGRRPAPGAGVSRDWGPRAWPAGDSLYLEVTFANLLHEDGVLSGALIHFQLQDRDVTEGTGRGHEGPP